MRIDAPFIPPSLTAAGGNSLVLPGDALLLDKLTLGQIIKGRVLRSYEGQRYSISFEGHERIVDSAVPLKTGDLIHGRVVGLGERIELQRVAVQSGEAFEGEAGLPQQRALPADHPLARLFDQYQASLAPEDARELQSAVTRAALPDLMALAGLVLSKLNLRMAPEFLRAVYGALSRGARGSSFALSGLVPGIQIESSQEEQGATSREAFASLMSRMLMEVPESRWPRDPGPGAKPEGSPAGATQGVQDPAGGSASGSGQAGGDGGFDLARWILNAQNGGMVAHRVGTLPLLIDGRLVELDVALFEEPPGEEGQASHIRHRRVVLAMDTETLGRIEASALFAADHIRVTLSTSSSESTGALARHMGPLTAELEQSGWRVDEMKYETRAPVAPGEVMSSVVEHLIRPGSVSRLV